MTNAIPIQESWEFCPRCGAKTSSTQTNPFCCNDCGHTHYFSPNTAVGALIVDDRAAMLFIVRGKDPGKGKLGLPGGFVDSGETAEQALVREIREEVGLDIRSHEYLASFPNAYAFRGVTIPVTDLFFVAYVATLNGMKGQQGEVDDWRFLKPKDINSTDLAFDTHRLALEAYLKKHDLQDRESLA